MKIYFAGAIRGGRADRAQYLELVELLKAHGTVLTEHVADEKLTRSANSPTIVQFMIEIWPG